MKQARAETLTAFRVEGGALAPSLLRRIQERNADYTDDGSYHLGKFYTVRDAVADSWNRMRNAWRAFQQERERLRAEPPAGVTRDKLLLPLFETLGYGRVPYKGGLQVGPNRYPISHAYDTIPIHLVGSDTDLDRKTQGVAGAAQRSPHGLVLEYLNQPQTATWGFVSNGKILRLLRENRNIARQSYLEFDLEYILEQEAYADFFLLWMVCHVSRLENRPEGSILEAWRSAGITEGERAMDDLREGVEQAIELLGSGFLAHSQNGPLREALRKGKESGGLDTEEFYHLLLILVYRLVFLFVAEDRDALLDPEADVRAKKRYLDYYSTKRLRHLAAAIRGGGHGDLWQGMRRVMDLLGEEGCPHLGLKPLGSFLWEKETLGTLSSCELSNYSFLEAVRKLAFTQRADALWPTDFKHLGSEELGSVYESLLELHPELNVDAGTFTLSRTAGSRRKTTGSYYTPSELVERILDDALEPVLEKAMTNADPEQGLLRVKVCDPAMGSGHFLTAAAARIARRLAQVRTGEEEPPPPAVREALQDAVQHCVYGVDLNPLAVELCKISLWMTALVPGRPLAFLDHHLKCGNSLIGATRELMKEGIPDSAFELLEGDDPTVVKGAKKRNQEYRQYVGSLFDQEEVFPDHGKFARMAAELEELDETTLEGVRLLAMRYQNMVEDPEYLAELSAADAWCAAFFQEKSDPQDPLITNEQFRVWLKDPMRVDKRYRDLAKRLSAHYRFFHWELAFPEVFRPSDGSPGGFHAVVGNPPWERVKLQEQEWFASRDPQIAQAPTASIRKQLIEKLKRQPDAKHLYREYQKALRSAEAFSSFLRKSGRFPLCGKGDVNLYSVFTELGRSLLRPGGQAGMIVPSGIATDDTTKDFFGDLVETQSLVSLYDFENKGIFPAVHNSYKFCLLTLRRPIDSGSPKHSGKSKGSHAMRFAFFAHRVTELEEPERIIDLEPTDFALINPNTRTCPIFRTRKDAEITRKVYQRVPVLIKEGDPTGNPWGISFLRLIDMANDSHLFRTREDLEREGYILKGNIFYPPGASIPPNPYAQVGTGIVPTNPDSHATAETQKRRSPATPQGKAPQEVTPSLFGREPDEGSASPQASDKQIDRPATALRGQKGKGSAPSGAPNGRYLPLYEAKMIHHFDHRWATYDGKDTRELTETERADPSFEPLPRYWVPEVEVEVRLKGRWDRGWLVGWRDITNTTNERTVIASVIPRTGVGDTFLLMFIKLYKMSFLLFTNLNSICLDFIARQKVGGTHLKYHVFKQLPVLPPDKYLEPCPWDPSSTTLADWIRPRVIKLVYTTYALLPFVLDAVAPGATEPAAQAWQYWKKHFPGSVPEGASAALSPYPPPFPWNPELRFDLRCQLDAAYFHLYGLTEEEVAYVLETFPIVKKKDLDQDGVYSTKETILKYYREYGSA